MTALRQPSEEPRRPAAASMIVAICGDPIVGRALALLLRSSLYDARFLISSPLSETGSLEDVQLLLLTPAWELYADRREDILALLGDESVAAEIPVLELTSSSFGGERNGHARLRPEHTVSWPCTTEELERRIQAALLTDPGDLSSSAILGGEGA